MPLVSQNQAAFTQALLFLSVADATRAVAALQCAVRLAGGPFRGDHDLAQTEFASSSWSALGEADIESLNKKVVTVRCLRTAGN